MSSNAADGSGADFSSHAKSDQPGSDRSFGLVFTGVFILAAILPALHHGRVRPWALAVAAAFLVAALLRPSVLRHLNMVWFRFGLLLGKVVTPVMMGLIFLVAVTPIAVLRRRLKSTGLDISFDPKAESYWIPRERTARSFKQQF
jgi:Saxitoxin biosynthesis operon protein SxtJ